MAQHFWKSWAAEYLQQLQKNEQMEDTTSEPPSRGHCASHGKQPCNNSLAHGTRDFHLSWERRPQNYYEILQATSRQTGAASPRIVRKGHSLLVGGMSGLITLPVPSTVRCHSLLHLMHCNHCHTFLFVAARQPLPHLSTFHCPTHHARFCLHKSIMELTSLSCTHL